MAGDHAAEVEALLEQRAQEDLLTGDQLKIGRGAVYADAGPDPLVDALAFEPFARRAERHYLASFLDRLGRVKRIPEVDRLIDRDLDCDTGKGLLRCRALQADGVVAGKAQFTQRRHQARVAADGEGAVDAVAQTGTP